MGCNIHIEAFKKVNSEYVRIEGDFNISRDSSIFAFLAGVNNFESIEPISPAREFPEWFTNSEYYDYDFHTRSWLTVEELINYDYNKLVKTSKAESGEELGFIKEITLREFLDVGFFYWLDKLNNAGVEVIVFAFEG